MDKGVAYYVFYSTVEVGWYATNKILQQTYGFSLFKSFLMRGLIQLLMSFLLMRRQSLHPVKDLRYHRILTGRIVLDIAALNGFAIGIFYIPMALFFIIQNLNPFFSAALGYF